MTGRRPIVAIVVTLVLLVSGAGAATASVPQSLAAPPSSAGPPSFGAARALSTTDGVAMGAAEVARAGTYAGTYTVVHGDTVRSIAAKLHLYWQDLASWNRIVTPYPVRTGQRLRTTSPDGLRGFRYTVRPVGAAQLPYSYRAGCPVAPSGLRILEVYYYGFDRKAHTGRIVVAAAWAGRLVRVFDKLYGGRFPIARMDLVDRYGGSDDASMAADNTSAFNCRPVAGTSSWSRHAYGTAVDLNTIENPYVSGGYVSPPAGVGYVDRSRKRPGMINPGGIVDLAFAYEGWEWGGRWQSPIDYQHFSTDGH